MWHALVFSAFPNGQFAKFSFIYVFIRFLLSQIVSFFRKVFFSWSFLFMLFFFPWSFLSYDRFSLPFFQFFFSTFFHGLSFRDLSFRDLTLFMVSVPWSYFSWIFFILAWCSLSIYSGQKMLAHWSNNSRGKKIRRRKQTVCVTCLYWMPSQSFIFPSSDFMVFEIEWPLWSE